MESQSGSFQNPLFYVSTPCLYEDAVTLPNLPANSISDIWCAIGWLGECSTGEKSARCTFYKASATKLVAVSSHWSLKVLGGSICRLIGRPLNSRTDRRLG